MVLDCHCTLVRVTTSSQLGVSVGSSGYQSRLCLTGARDKTCVRGIKMCILAIDMVHLYWANNRSRSGQRGVRCVTEDRSNRDTERVHSSQRSASLLSEADDKVV